MQQCKVYKSARSPVLFVFEAVPTPDRHATPSADLLGQDSHRASDTSSRFPAHSSRLDRMPGSLPQPDVVQLLFKSGDDLRQDQFVCQVYIRALNVMLARPSAAVLQPLQSLFSALLDGRAAILLMCSAFFQNVAPK
jgi:hypothetical protein